MQAFTADELYSGDKVDLAPEIVLLVNDYRCSVSYRMDGPVYEDRPHHPMKSGSHRLNGILLATGPRITKAQTRDAQLQDVAPPREAAGIARADAQWGECEYGPRTDSGT